MRNFENIITLEINPETTYILHDSSYCVSPKGYNSTDWVLGFDTGSRIIETTVADIKELKALAKKYFTNGVAVHAISTAKAFDEVVA
jgi:hypothetical protein